MDIVVKAVISFVLSKQKLIMTLDSPNQPKIQIEGFMEQLIEYNLFDHKV